MAYGFKVRVEGDYALFCRPELKVERYTYELLTPSAARGILEAVFWKPGLRYVIDKIHLLKPIQVTNIRRNEVAVKALATKANAAMSGSGDPLFISCADNIQQRASLVLRDVAYIVEGHFKMTKKAGERDTPEKFYSMLLRRLRNGQCFHQPYLGCREFPARVSLVEEDETFTPIAESRDFGLMLYDLDYTDPQNIHPTFFRAVMQGGTLDLTDCEVMR